MAIRNVLGDLGQLPKDSCRPMEYFRGVVSLKPHPFRFIEFSDIHFLFFAWWVPRGKKSYLAPKQFPVPTAVSVAIRVAKLRSVGVLHEKRLPNQANSQASHCR